MHVITERTLISEVSQCWRKQYPDSRNDIYKALLKLDKKTATAADVKQIIGNDSWTRVPSCDECGDESPDAVVEIGQAPDYESRTAYVCRRCITAALRLLTPEPQP